MPRSGTEDWLAPQVGLDPSRKDFLRLGAFGSAGLALLGGAILSCGQTTVSAHALGLKPSNSARENRDRLASALARPSRTVTFPAGDYLIDNSSSRVQIHRFEGTLRMEPDARFVFTDNAKRGLSFLGGAGARFEGLNATFSVAAPVRISAMEALRWVDTTDTRLDQTIVENGPAAGLLFTQCVRPSVDGVKIRNTRADGLHFANCQEVWATNVVAENTGDDGLAFLNYGSRTDYSGGTATNVTVKNSGARGITVIGQRDVTIDGFQVDGTASSGLLCARDENYGTRTPSNVCFVNGTVENAGRILGQDGNKFGIDYSGISSVDFERIQVISPATRGVSGVAPDGTVRVSAVEVRDAPGSGFDLSADSLFLDELTARGTAKTGMYVSDSGLVWYDGLEAINTSKASPLHRAFSFANNARVQGRELRVVDDQSTPTGFKVVAYGPQSGYLGAIHDHVANGSVEVENPSELTHNLE